MLLVCAGASGAERWLRRAEDRRPFFEAALGFGAVLVAVDLGLVARGPIAQSFVGPSPELADSTAPFHVEHRLPPRADYLPGLWDIATLPGVMANVGTMECDTDLRLHSLRRDPEGRSPGVGAWGSDDPDYRGEVYVAEGGAKPTVTSWTPNAVRVRVDGAHAGDHVVLNQNWDPGWSADGVPAASYQDAVAAVLRAPDQEITFRFREPSFGSGVALLGATAAWIVLLLAGARRRVKA
jgi:hypothetical protein